MRPSTDKIIGLIQVDGSSAMPKYQQLTNSILKAIEAGQIRKDDIMPSINDLSFELDISRDTAEKGYKFLKKLGILGSVPGKGYFIQNVELRQEQKVFLLLNKMSAHKKVFFESFIAALGEHAIVDLFIYNNDFSLYKRSLSERKDEYSYYVVIPYTLEGEERGIELIDAIPRDKLIVLDKNIPGIQGDYAAVYEHFEEDIYVALEKARESLSKYNKIKIVFPHYSYHPFEILKGCRRFCEDYGFQFEEVQDLGNEPIGEGEVYITLMEEDLVTLAERIVSQQLALGRQVGVISYNETPLKRIILNGITTISTDFQQMGKMTAQMVLEHCRQQKAVPFNLELRGSL